MDDLFWGASPFLEFIGAMAVYNDGGPAPFGGIFKPGFDVGDIMNMFAAG